MSTITTYPLDNIDYNAADVATYNAPRTSGVYSTEDDFAVTAAGGLDVAVSSGIAWVRPERFAGYSVCNRDAAAVTLSMPDSIRPRIDRVVLRYDAAAKKTSLQVLEGTPDSASPAAPEITRTALVYDLCLAEIRRPAGSTEITAADITDTRADEDVCGVMRDGVTGIPTAQLQAQALAMMTQLSTELHAKLDALDAAIANVESGSFYTKTEADAKFGTPYTLPAATASTLGGVKVGDYLDIDADGTVSGKTLYNTITASVAVKTDPRLVWTYGAFTINYNKVHTYQIPANVDYINFHAPYFSDGSDNKQIPRGNTLTFSCGDNSPNTNNFTLVFQTDGTLVVTNNSSSTKNVNNVVITGYHYPTLADLLTETQAAQADTDALMVDQEYRVTLLELGLEE